MLWLGNLPTASALLIASCIESAEGIWQQVQCKGTSIEIGHAEHDISMVTILDNALGTHRNGFS